MASDRLTRSVVAAGLILGLALPSCTQTRSLEFVERSGDKAYEAGDYDLARKEYTEYVDRRPGKARVQYALGRSELALGRPQAAAQALWIAHDLEPLNEEYTETLATALYQAGDRGKLYEFLRSMTQQPGRVEDQLRLGRYAAKLGDADEAETAFLTAAKIDGGKTAHPQVALADFYQSIGDRAGALKRLRMALFIEPDNAEIAARIREFGEIPGPSFALTPEEAR